MWKFGKKKMLTIFFIFSLVFIGCIKVNAIGPIFGGRFKNGIGNICVYIDDKTTPAATYWQNLFKSAVNNWMYTGYGANKFYATYVSTSTNGSNIDVYGKRNSFFPQGDFVYYALTLHYNGNTYQDPALGNWYYANILLNDDILSMDFISNAEATGIFAHEIGHAFGMAHTKNKYSIMCQSGDGRQVQTVQQIDNDTLNYLYP